MALTEADKEYNRKNKSFRKNKERKSALKEWHERPLGKVALGILIGVCSGLIVLIATMIIKNLIKS